MEFENILTDLQNGDPLSLAILIVVILIALVSLFSAGVSIYLAVSYVKYNRRQNSAGLSGKDAARRILDENGLENIKVKCTGSMMFGNSYSHYFKKVRLRRLTWKKASISSLAMAAQKSSLAVLDKEGDPDMKRRVRLVPLITFGPFLFIPLLLIGIVIDILLFQDLGAISVICAAVGLAFYLYSFILSLTVLKTEKKAQARAAEILREKNMATEDEIASMQDLFRLYNIEYVNDMILAMLELIYYVLRIVASARGNSSSSSGRRN